MKLDFDRIATLMNIITKSAEMGFPELVHIATLARMELREIHEELTKEQMASRGEQAPPHNPAPASEDDATPPAGVPIDSVPRDQYGNVIQPPAGPRAIPSYSVPTEPDRSEPAVNPDPNNPDSNPQVNGRPAAPLPRSPLATDRPGQSPAPELERKL